MDTVQGPSLHVALNAQLLSGDPSYRSAGVHQYIYRLLLHLPHAGCRVTAFVGPSAGLPRAVCAIRTRWPTHRPLVRVLWEQFAQPLLLREVNADLVHGPVYVVPLGTSIPAVVTVHDLSFLRFPRFFRPANRLYLRLFTYLSVHRARRVLAVSAYTARETEQLLGVRREKIRVVYHGVDPVFRPLRPHEVAAFRARHGLPDRFVLYVGTLEPRKNLVRLVQAVARLSEADRPFLVLAGARGWYDEEIFATVERLNLKDRVLFPGYIPNEQLPLWYNAAQAFAYPSLYEGFGMPVLEALACGTPVLTSTASALPEAAGDGALLVDPTDVGAIADGLHRLLTDEALREELRERGLAHAARFSWARTAAETVALYREAIAEGGER
ncbi:MAG: glycosyltransferase family 1 protein [Anaerolineae bacterium]|nr:glycosyltransferase family 4 protein [Anaerolineae bacterium]MCX8066427.1 glycosyltransferase family 4 protein [Anaerolineae bacterium]MDW7992958.1 glycosyltransferase family 1 protein [Anaerolineae bacterium]